MGNATRRSFLKQLVLSNQPASHSLVCVFLRGGADTLNMVVPYGDDQYYTLRPTLSISPPNRSGGGDASIRLNDFYAFHPGMRPLFPIFDEGRLGIVQSVGSDNPTGSHFDAQDQMERGESYKRPLGGGWLGRYLRVREGDDIAPLSAVAIGTTIPESLRGAPSVSALESVEEIQIKSPSGDSSPVASALSAMYGADVGVLRQPGLITLDLLKRVERLRGNHYRPDNGAEYPDDSFGAGLREIARLVKADVGLEVACIDLGGWDTHFFQGTTGGLQAGVIDQLAQGFAAFDSDLLHHRDKVTTIVITEFGRRIYENGSMGTDHGRGFAMMATGSGINGGKVHGVWPGLEEEAAPGPGGLKINFDYRSVLWEVLDGVMGNPNAGKIFPGFKRANVGLVHLLRSA